MKEYTEQEINELVADIQNTFNNEVQALLKSEGSMVSDENRAAQGGHVKGMGAQKKTPESAPEMVDDENAENSVAAHGYGKAERSSASESSSSSSMSKEESSMSKDEDAPPAEGSASSASAAPDEGATEEAPEAPPAAPPEQAAAPEAPAPGQEMQGQPGNDQQGLEQAYSQLSDEELHAHYDAIKCAVMARMAGAGAAGPGMAQGQMPPEAPPAAPPAGGGAPMAMSAVEDKLEKLNKAQTEKIAELEKQLEGVTKLFEKMLTAPQQKSVTTLAQFQAVAKSETSTKKPVTALTKSEITNKLGAAMSDAKTSNKDRDLVNRYFLDGGVKLEDLAHLLQ